MLRYYHYTNFSTCLNSKRFINALKLIRNIFQLFQTICISLQRLSSCTRSCSRNSICCLYDTCDQRFRFYITMMGCDRINDDL